MKKKKGLKILCLSVLILFMSSFLSAQRQTGSISGVVSDDEGSFLPGVEVSIASPSLMGVQSFVSRTDGTFRFPAVSPGMYTITVKLAGFQTMERPGVLVHVGADTFITFGMPPAVQEEEVVVTAPSPMIDTKSSKLTSVFTSHFMTNIPVGRDVFEVVQTAPSVIGDTASMVSVHGAVLNQTRYVLDGVDITDPLRGYRSTWLTFDAVEEVEMVLGALGAENAKASAGFINVVTKSGGNRFSGGLTGTYTHENLYSSSFTQEDLGALGLSSPTFNNFEYDISASLGGPIFKDKLWFFVNPRYLARQMTGAFVPFTAGTGEYFEAYSNDRKQGLGFGKLTWQVSNKWKYVGMLHAYQANENPYSWWNNPKYAWTRSHDYTYTASTVSNILSFVINQNTFSDLKVGYVRVIQDNIDFYNNGERPLEMQAYDRYTGNVWGLIPWNEGYKREKVDVDWGLTKFLDGFLGANHEVKVGLGYTWWKTKIENWTAANYRENWYKGEPWNFANTTPYMGTINIENMNNDRNATGPRLVETHRIGLFFQDIISIGTKLHLNLGIRYDRAAVSRPEETRPGWFDEWGNGLANLLAPDIFPLEDLVAPAIKNAIVWDKIQPRIGVTYDPFGDGKTAIRAHYSRMIDDITGDMTKGLHPFDPWINAMGGRWWDDNQNGKHDLPPIDRYLITWRPAEFITDPDELSKSVDPNMTSPFVDEFTFGIHREIFEDVSFGVTYIYRDQKNISDQLDTNNPLDSTNWLPYTVTDPGPDAALGTADDSPITVYGLKADAPFQQRLRTNVEVATRKYQGVEFVLNKRMADGWQFSGNVVLSKSYGNIGGGWASWRGDRGGFLNPNQLVNAMGRTNFDRPLMVKLMGTVTLPWDLILSGYYSYATGGPGNRTLTVYLPSVIDGVPNKSISAGVKAEAAGAFRGPNVSILDVRLEKVVRTPMGRFGFYVDAFNLLGWKSLAINKNNGGEIFLDGTFEVFPQYGNINAAQGVRYFLLTLRYSF